MLFFWKVDNVKLRRSTGIYILYFLISALATFNCYEVNSLLNFKVPSSICCQLTRFYFVYSIYRPSPYGLPWTNAMHHNNIVTVSKYCNCIETHSTCKSKFIRTLLKQTVPKMIKNSVHDTTCTYNLTIVSRTHILHMLYFCIILEWRSTVQSFNNQNIETVCAMLKC